MKTQKQVFLSISVAALSVAISCVANLKLGFAAEHHASDKPDTHNMLVVGEESVYLSHLPMFNTPHRYQVIVEVAFANQGDDPQETYRKDRRENRTTNIYMLNPHKFVLPILVSLGTESEAVRSFKAAGIYRGHFEREGKVRLLDEVDVNVKRVVHFRELNNKSEKPAQLEYILFGKGRELFLAHLITAPPDFDQVLSVKVTGQQFTDEQLAQGVPIVLPGTINSATKRLKSNQRAMGEVKSGNPLVSTKIGLEIEREIYFEEGELGAEADFESTQEEILSDFP